MTTFWQQLESKKITNRGEIEKYLTQKLGTPTNQLAFNCLSELTKKINSYYYETVAKNYSVYSLVGSLTSPEQIIEKKFKEGKRTGQTYYILKVGNERIQASQELEPSKWEQITNLAIIGQNLVFKYRKFYTNKELLDFLPRENGENLGTKSHDRKDGEGIIGQEPDKDSKR